MYGRKDGRFQVPETGSVEWLLDTGMAGEAAGESWQRSRSGTAFENGTLLGYRKGGEAYKTFCLTSFAVALTSSESTLKKTDIGFRSCYFLPPCTQNWAGWRKLM